MSTYRLNDEMKKLRDLGIDISVYIDEDELSSNGFKSEILQNMLTEGAPYEPAEDGFIDRWDKDARFSIVLRMPTRPDVSVVIASGGKEKKLSRLSNFSKTEYLTVKNVSTHTILAGCTTKPPDNSFKIVSTADNVLRVFEVSIATRILAKGCHHFLTVQEVYTGQLYYDVNLQTIMVPVDEYPGYRNWPSLQDLVLEMVDPNQLPREVTPISKQIPPINEPGRGRVLFFNASTGRGLAKITGNKVAGLHWKEIKVKESFPYVQSGDEICFTESRVDERGYIKILGVTPV